jgi:dipeptide/tripeptide permease
MFSYSSALAYFMPLGGGIIADTKLGKYRTILYFSLIYVFGSFILSITSIDGLVWGAILGLLLIAIGTGGLKPCVSAFGAEQFSPVDEESISAYFHAFYFAINTGSVVSFALTPLIRKYFGYSVAFSIPCVLLFTATGIFFRARHQYTHVHPNGNAFVKVLSSIWEAGFVRRNLPLNHDQHWIERSNIPVNQVNEIRSVLQIMKIFSTLPTFWMLYEIHFHGAVNLFLHC